MSNIRFSDKIVLMAIADKSPITIEEISGMKNIELDDVHTIVNKLEKWGMVSGTWEKRSGQWVREYWISGEGTLAYIEELRI